MEESSRREVVHEECLAGSRGAPLRRTRTLLDPRTWLAAYSVTISLYLPLAILLPGMVPPVTLLGQVRPFLLLLAGPALVLALLSRRRWSAVGLAIGFCAGLWYYHEPLAQVVGLNGGLSRSAVEGDLTVETWNLGLGRSSVEQAVDHLSRCSADLVALQEYVPAQESALRKALADRYPHQVYHGEGRSSLALLSREELHEPIWHEPERGKPWLQADLDLDGRRVRVITVHFSAFIATLSHWWPDRDVLEEILGQEGERRSTILLGDLNGTESSAEYQRLVAAGWVNAFAETGRGFGFTFPVFLRYRGVPLPPVVRVDHVWTSGAIHPVSCRVEPDAGSDHLPLVAELAFDPD